MMRRPPPWPPQPRPARLGTGAKVGIGCGAASTLAVATLVIASVLLSGPSDASPHPPKVDAPRLHLTATLTDPHSGSGGVSGDYFSPDGSTLYASDSDGTTYQWRMATRTVTATLQLPADTQALALSPDGTTFAAGDSTGTTYLLDARTRRITAAVTDPVGPFSQVPDGDPVTPGVPEPQTTVGVLDIAFSPDGKILAVADSSAFVDFYSTGSVRTGAAPSYVATLPRPAEAAIAFSPDGKTLAAGSDGSDAYLWDIAAHHRTVTLTDPDQAEPFLDSVAFSPDGKTLAMTDEVGHIYLWNVTTRAVTARLTEPGQRPDDGRLETWAVFSRDGKTLATWDYNGDAGYLWDVATRRIVAVAALRNGGVNSIAFSPDGATLAIADSDGATYLWALPASVGPN